MNGILSLLTFVICGVSAQTCASNTDSISCTSSGCLWNSTRGKCRQGIFAKCDSINAITPAWKARIKCNKPAADKCGWALNKCGVDCTKLNKWPCIKEEFCSYDTTALTCDEKSTGPLPLNPKICGECAPGVICATTSFHADTTAFEQFLGNVKIEQDYAIAFKVTANRLFDADNVMTNILHFGTGVRSRQPYIGMVKQGGKMGIMFAINCNDSGLAGWTGMSDYYWTELEWTIGNTYTYQFTVKNNCVKFQVDGVYKAVRFGPFNRGVNRDRCLNTVGSTVPAYSYQNWGDASRADASGFMTITQVTYAKVA